MNAIQTQLNALTADRLGSAAQAIQHIFTDTRKLTPGALFVALKGEHFDGHAFIKEAVEKGAVALLVSQKITDLPTHVTQYIVPDTTLALGQLATAYRQTMTCPTIALTGSNGKTSVKEMIAQILPKPAHATPGNLNNHLGVPLSLLQWKPTDRYAVFELGANHPNEIAYTVAMVKPDVALINNIAPAHIAGFGSIEGVARAKGEIYSGLSASGIAVVNDDTPYAHFWDDILQDKHVLRFSAKHQAGVMAKDITLDEQGLARFKLVLPEGESSVTLQVPGLHSVSNALAAATCGYAVGLDITCIAQGLMRFSGVSGRMTYLKGMKDTVIIDDTYNANLQSVLSAIDVLANRTGIRILVLGDLGELGEFSEPHHQQIGQVAKEKGIHALLTCGRLSALSSEAFGIGARHYASQAPLAQDLLALLSKDATVLVKGSRSAKMENIVEHLVTRLS